MQDVPAVRQESLLNVLGKGNSGITVNADIYSGVSIPPAWQFHKHTVVIVDLVVLIGDTSHRGRIYSQQ